MTEGELDEILTFKWPGVVRATMSGNADDWVMGFVRSIARQARNPAWRPSPKQSQIMRRLVSDLIAHEPEFELIERCERSDPAHSARGAVSGGSVKH